MRRLLLGTVLAAAGIAGAPAAGADVLHGNYELLSNRWTDVSWVWAFRSCNPPSPGCTLVAGGPRPTTKAAAFQADVRLAEGRYRFSVDVPDGVRCFGANLPSHDTYTFDAATLAGWVDSSFEVGCGGAPGGTDTYTFSLVRM